MAAITRVHSCGRGCCIASPLTGLSMSLGAREQDLGHCTSSAPSSAAALQPSSSSSKPSFKRGGRVELSNVPSPNVTRGWGHPGIGPSSSSALVAWSATEHPTHPTPHIPLLGEPKVETSQQQQGRRRRLASSSGRTTMSCSVDYKARS